VRFRAGDMLDPDDPEIELTRYRLLGTGFFSNVQLSLRKGSERGRVVLVVHVVERNTLVVNDLWMGLTADADRSGAARPLSAYGGIDLSETNLAGTGITLGAAIGVAQDQLALRTRFFDPAFLGSTWMASASLLYNDARDFFGNRDVLYDDPNATTRVQDFAIVAYRRFGGTVGTGHDLSVATQLWLDWRLEQIDARLPLAASHRRGLDVEPIRFDVLPGKSVLSTARATLMHDTRDQPILPTRGWFASVSTDLALSPLGSDYGYAKLQLRASRWWTLPWRHVVRVEAFGGAISGAAPFFEKFYVGDFSDLLPDRVLDLNPDRRPAPNLLGTDIVEVRYGDYAAKLQGEYRVPLYRGHRAVYGVDLFAAGGLYGVAAARDLVDPPRGYRALQRIPVDLTFNLGLRMDTNAGGFAFAFSNVLGFLPVRGEGRP
jgi:outer membrane protein assembly factor BamA